MVLTNLEKHTTKNPINRFFLRNFLQTLVALAKPLKAKAVLDVGCGEGFTLARLRDEKIGKILEGVDVVKEALRVSKKLHPDISCKTGNIYRLKYKDNSFDIVICTEVLEHLQNPLHAFRELLRVSKKYILVSVPNEPWFTMQRILRGKNILHLGAHPEHVQWWTATAFEQFVKEEKVVIIAKRFPFPWTMILLRKR